MGVLVRVALRVVLVMVHLLAAVVDVGAILVAMVPGDVGTVVVCQCCFLVFLVVIFGVYVDGFVVVGVCGGIGVVIVILLSLCETTTNSQHAARFL